MKIQQAIPTYILTGFLGVGKTTCILSILKDNPDRNWAVLVNEFGEVGVDAELLGTKSLDTDSGSIALKQVPGGCMCCAAKLPMQVALNQLIKSANPDAILIEPTGLGHPKEVIEVLQQSYYQGVLALKGVFTLLDARHFSNEKYTSNDTFVQQLQVADCLVANKAELANEQDWQALATTLAQLNIADKALYKVDFAAINLDWISNTTHVPKRKLALAARAVAVSEQLETEQLATEQQTWPHSGFDVLTKQADGFDCFSALVAANLLCSLEQINKLDLSQAGWVRLKAALNTPTGSVRLNWTIGATEIDISTAVTEVDKPILEIIAEQGNYNAALFTQFVKILCAS